MAGQLAVFSREQFTIMMQEIGVTQVEEFMMIFTLKVPTAPLKKPRAVPKSLLTSLYDR